MNADEVNREDILTNHFRIFFSFIYSFFEGLKFHSARTIAEEKQAIARIMLSPFRLRRKFIYYKDRSRHIHRDRSRMNEREGEKLHGSFQKASWT